MTRRARWGTTILVVMVVVTLVLFFLPFGDTLIITGGANADVVAFVDGRTEEGCVRDLLARGRAWLSPGNMLSPAGCHSELTLFQLDRAMYFEERERWSDRAGELSRVQLSRRLEEIEVSIRLTGGSTYDDDEQRARNDLARANQLFNTMRCGLRFSLKSIKRHPEITGFDACGLAQHVNEKVAKAEKGVVNIYYTPILKPLKDYSIPRGVFCTDPYATVLISRAADNEVLTHELGHVLSLQHGGDLYNVMNEGTGGRRLLAEGQCFRCNRDDRSFANWKGSDIIPKHSCPGIASNNKCPPASRTSRSM